jgi:hypothetical protein
MSKMSNYLENKIFDHVLRATTYTSPSTVYVALFTSDPTDAASGTEVSTSGTAYARQAITMGAPSNGAGTNSAEVAFPEATANWGTVSHFAIFDAASGGNMLIHGALGTAKAVNTGQVARFASGQLSVSFD